MNEATHPGQAADRLVPGQRFGPQVGLVFGVIYIEANAGPFRPAVALSLRLAGLVAGGAVLVNIGRHRRRAADPPVTVTSPRSGTGVDRRYWLIVGAEVVALAIGLALLNGPLHAARAAVAWVSLVVGLHFFALSIVFRGRLYSVLGAAIGACGAAGLGLAASGAPGTWIAGGGGIIPGVILLGSAQYGGRARGAGGPGP